jgi:CheY-like chemotaxis protein
MAKYAEVMSIDDDSITALITRKLIAATQFADHFLTYSGCKEALEYIAQSIEKPQEFAMPQIIMLDLNLPVYNGWYFMEQLAKMPVPPEKMPQLYILSSTKNSEDYYKAMQYPFVKNFFIKPLMKEHLENM